MCRGEDHRWDRQRQRDQGDSGAVEPAGILRIRRNGSVFCGSSADILENEGVRFFFIFSAGDAEKTEEEENAEKEKPAEDIMGEAYARKKEGFWRRECRAKGVRASVPWVDSSSDGQWNGTGQRYGECEDTGLDRLTAAVGRQPFGGRCLLLQ